MTGQMLFSPDVFAKTGPVDLHAPTCVILDIDLRHRDHVNIDFRTVAQDRIPLHLSLRRKTGQLVVNRWSPAGWRRELAFAAPLRHAVHELRLDLSSALQGGVQVTLWLDGQRLGRLDRWPRPCKHGRFWVRRGFPDLRDLGWMTWPDGLQSLRCLPVSGGAPLVLTTHLELVLSSSETGVWLDLGDGQTGPEFLPAAQGPTPALLRAPVAGRIWRGAGDDMRVLTARSSAGMDIARIELHQGDLLRLLARPDLEWLLQHDVMARLQWLEHVHYADLWQAIPDTIRAILSAQAAQMPSAAFKPQAKGPARGMPMPQDPVRAACDAFHRSQNRSSPPDPLLVFRTQVRLRGLQPAQVRQLACLLSEWFCLISDPRALSAAAQELGVKDCCSENNRWADIAALPLIWATGDWDCCLRLLRELRSHRPDWIVTPALAWLAHAIARADASSTGARPDLPMRVALAQALLDLIAAYAPAYMAQTDCARLTTAICALLQASTEFPDWCQPYFAELALQAYGLSPGFWDRPDTDLPAMLQPWKTAFAALKAACLAGDPARIHACAKPFLAQPIAGRDALRRLALGAQALPVGADGLPDLEALTGLTPPAGIEDAALRWLAFPRPARCRAALPLRMDSPVHQAARFGMRKATVDVPRPLHARAQIRLGAMTQRALAELRAGRLIPAEDLDQILCAARALVLPEAGFLGLSALLALAEALARAGAMDQAQSCVTEAAEHIRRWPGDSLASAPAVALAVARFDALCPDRGLRSRITALLPPDADLLPPATEERPLAALRRRANPFSDTLVAVISCHANLTTRLPDICASWGKTLADWAIPMVAVVGRSPDQHPGAGTRFDGRVLKLDVADDYEGLPQKTLALMDWARSRTGFGRVLKIDDDCFLNVDAFFSDPAFMTVPYFGRPLYRGPGDMDRAWHMARARGARGQFELDKSPEPSCYADGGSGYVLDRRALNALDAARGSLGGKRLEQLSFMEDKLVGDLLASAGIAVQGPGYDLAIFRKTARNLPAIAQYHDSFLPFAGAPMKLVHLDGGASMQQVAAAAANPWPAPMKIWPLHRAAGLGWAQHGLNLVSPPERLERAAHAQCAVVSVMRDEAFMIEHFLTHYRRLGVDGFLIVDNGSRDGTLDYLACQDDVALFTTDTPYRQSAYGVVWQEALLAQFRLGKWSLIADGDELLFWTLPDAAGQVQGNLPALLHQPELATAEAVRVFLFDLYPKGNLAQTRFDTAPFLEAGYLDRAPLCTDWQGRGPWANCVTHTSALRHRLARDAGLAQRADLFVAQKYPLLRYHPFMKLSTGLHYITGAKLATRDLAFGHFKYHAQFHAKAAQEAARGQHFNNAEEYRLYLQMLAEGQGSLFKPGVSVRLAQCDTLRALCQLPPTDHIAHFRDARPATDISTSRPMRYTMSLPAQVPGRKMATMG